MSPRSCSLTSSAKVLYVTYTTEFPSRWFGFLDDRDCQSPHIVRMTEGLMYFENKISFTNKPYINFGEYFSFNSEYSHLVSRKVKIKTYRTVILHDILYGCETWFLTLKETNKQECLDITVLRRIFGPKRKEITVGWRKLRSEELHDFLSTPGIMLIR